MPCWERNRRQDAVVCHRGSLHPGTSTTAELLLYVYLKTWGVCELEGGKAWEIIGLVDISQSYSNRKMYDEAHDDDIDE